MKSFYDFSRISEQNHCWLPLQACKMSRDGASTTFLLPIHFSYLLHVVSDLN